MTQATRVISHRGGVPIYRYRNDPDASPVSVHRHAHGAFDELGPHIHDFPALGTSPRRAWCSWLRPVRCSIPGSCSAWMTGSRYSSSAALGEDARSPWPAWRAHPLLFPFLHGQSGGVLRRRSPTRQPFWDNVIRSIEMELTGGQEGYRQAALAHLTLLLIGRGAWRVTW